MFSAETVDSGQPSSDFGTWWSAISPRLLKSAKARVRGSVDAEDLVQEVALIALRRGGTFASSEDLLKWSFTVLHSRLIDRVRSEKRRGERLSILGRLLPKAFQPNYERSIDAGYLREAVTGLPPRQKEIMQRFLNGDSTEEIARDLGITEATVRSLKRFAQLHLAREMTAADVGLAITS